MQTVPVLCLIQTRLSLKDAVSCCFPAVLLCMARQPRSINEEAGGTHQCCSRSAGWSHAALGIFVTGVCNRCTLNLVVLWSLKNVTLESGSAASALLQLPLVWQAPLCHPLEGSVTVLDMEFSRERLQTDKQILRPPLL